MKTSKIKQTILSELSDMPEETFTYGDEDAARLHVSFPQLEDILSDLHNDGLIKRHNEAGVPNCKITIRGMEAIEDTQDDSESLLGGRVDAALKVLNEAQERSKGILEEGEAKHQSLKNALDNRKEDDPLPEEMGGILPASTVQLMIQRVVVQLRGEFIEALEAIKGS